MEYLLLGRTGLRVSKLALGTAAFGLENYGIHEPGARVDSAKTRQLGWFGRRSRKASISSIRLEVTARARQCWERL
jgi:aryl-alcohol dehydrogenase-like predicted oxidoreductase